MTASGGWDYCAPILNELQRIQSSPSSWPSSSPEWQRAYLRPSYLLGVHPYEDFAMALLEEVVALTAAPGPALRLLMDAAPVLSALVLQV